MSVQVQVLTIGPTLPPGWEGERGECDECGGECAPECGKHPLGCVFGGCGYGYWLIADGCGLDHGECS